MCTKIVMIQYTTLTSTTSFSWWQLKLLTFVLAIPAIFYRKPRPDLVLSFSRALIWCMLQLCTCNGSNFMKHLIFSWWQLKLSTLIAAIPAICIENQAQIYCSDFQELYFGIFNSSVSVMVPFLRKVWSNLFWDWFFKNC